MPENDEEPSHLVVVGVDGSDASIEAVRWACEQARLTGSIVEVVTAWQWPMSWGPAVPLPSDYDPAADATSMVDQLIAPLAREFPTVTIRSRAVEGHAAAVLIEASHHADLLVVSSRGHGEFSGMLIGSVSQHCVSHAACPVLVYRTADRRG